MSCESAIVSHFSMAICSQRWKRHLKIAHHAYHITWHLKQFILHRLLLIVHGTTWWRFFRLQKEEIQDETSRFSLQRGVWILFRYDDYFVTNFGHITSLTFFLFPNSNRNLKQPPENSSPAKRTDFSDQVSATARTGNGWWPNHKNLEISMFNGITHDFDWALFYVANC